MNTAAEFLMPTWEQVVNLKVGDLAPDYAGRMLPVVEIYAQSTDCNGRAFVCYYVASPTGNGSSSNSMKEGELHRSVALVAGFDSAQLDAVERQMRQERGYDVPGMRVA